MCIITQKWGVVDLTWFNNYQVIGYRFHYVSLMRSHHSTSGFHMSGATASSAKVLGHFQAEFLWTTRLVLSHQRWNPATSAEPPSKWLLGVPKTAIFIRKWWWIIGFSGTRYPIFRTKQPVEQITLKHLNCLKWSVYWRLVLHNPDDVNTCVSHVKAGLRIWHSPPCWLLKENICSDTWETSQT